MNQQQMYRFETSNDHGTDHEQQVARMDSPSSNKENEWTGIYEEEEHRIWYSEEDDEEMKSVLLQTTSPNTSAAAGNANSSNNDDESRTAQKSRIEDHDIYEKVPDTVAALQQSHRTLLSQLRETQEMLEHVLDENDSLKRQLCSVQTALTGAQRMHESAEGGSAWVVSNRSYGQPRLGTNSIPQQAVDKLMKETRKTMSSIAEIHKREARSAKMQRRTLQEVLTSQDLSDIVTL